MTGSQIRNLGQYALWALIGAVVATGVQLGTVLSGSDAIEVRPLAAVFVTTLFGTLTTVLGASALTRLGSEGVAAQVNALKAQGVPRDRMVVLRDDEAALALAQADDISGLTDEQVRTLTTRLIERMQATSAAPPMVPMTGGGADVLDRSG